MDRLLGKVRDRAGLTPDQGIQVVTVDQLVRRPFDPAMALVIVQSTGTPGAADDRFGVLPGRHGHGPDPIELLRRLYSPDHPVHGLDDDSQTTLGELTAQGLRAGTWLLPPLPDLDNVASPWGLPWLVATLRAPDGCPWDREQDHRCWKRRTRCTTR
jgi:tetrapyrrole methylase family protein/MazG family protein